MTVFIESKGVEISDNKEVKEYKLNSDETINDWHVISVEDTGDERYTVTMVMLFNLIVIYKKQRNNRMHDKNTFHIKFFI